MQIHMLIVAYRTGMLSCSKQTHNSTRIFFIKQSFLFQNLTLKLNYISVWLIQFS